MNSLLQQYRIGVFAGLVNPDLNDETAIKSMKAVNETGEIYCPIYPEDLNAMHVVEKLLTEHQKHVYIETLAKMIHPLNEWIVFASAAQRAEAFLKVLNLWKY